jgi:two-component system sensor histidine kinase AlgZ
VEALPERTPIPALVLQPLLENAVYHGIERLPEGGTVRIDGGTQGGVHGPQAWICIQNPLPLPGSGGTPRTGHQEALANIRERLALLYAGSAGLETHEAAGVFTARLHWPDTREERLP